MRQRRSWAIALLVCLFLMRAGVTRAEPAAPASDAARQEASGHFQRGVELFQEGAFRAALVEFERAYGIAPDYRLLYNIGQVKLQLQDYLGATQSYESYLEQGGSDIPEARRDDVEEAFETLRQRVGRISVTANRDGAEVFIDDQRAGETPMAATVAVNVGRHRVLARSADGATASKTIDIAGGDLIDVALELEAPDLTAGAAENKPPLPMMKRAAIGSWAAGGVMLLGAGATAWLAKSNVDDRNAELEKDLPTASKVKDFGSSADAFAITTDVLAVLGLVGIGAGVWLWLRDDGTKAAETDAEPPAVAGNVQWGVGLGTVTAKGHF